MAEPPKPKAKRLPRLYNNVLKAIGDLKEPSGSTLRTIANQVQGVMNATRAHSRIKDVTNYVEKALQYALKHKAVVYNKGRYRLFKESDKEKDVKNLKKPTKQLKRKAPIRARKPKATNKRKPNKILPKDVQHDTSDTSFTSTVVPKKIEKPNNKNMLDFTSCGLRNSFQLPRTMHRL